MKLPDEQNDKQIEAGTQTNVFSDETINSLNELGLVLSKIRNRLISEGYIICDGQIAKKMLELKDEYRCKNSDGDNKRNWER